MDPEVERERALEALSLMRRRKLSLTEAAREVEISRSAVEKWVGKALIRRRGRVVPRPFDRIPRTIRFLDEFGVIEVEVRDSRTATRVAQWWSAVDWYLKTGDETGLKPFRRKSFSSHGVVFVFVTDLELLGRLALVGQVTFEDLYARVG